MINRFRLFSRVLGAWLLVVFWWGNWLIDPFQGHTEAVIRLLPWIGSGGFVFVLLSFFSQPVFRPARSLIWLIPLLLLSLTALLIHPNIALQALILGLCLLIIGCWLDFKALSRTGLAVSAAFTGLFLSAILIGCLRSYPCLGDSFFGYQLSCLLNLFGANTSLNQGVLFFNQEQITLDLLKSGLYLVVAFYLCFACLVLCARASLKIKLLALLIGLITHYAYGLLRLVWVAFSQQSNLYTGFVPFDLNFWRWAVLSFCLLIPIWYLLLRLFSLEEIIELNPLPCRLKNKDWLWPALLLLTALSIGASSSFYGLTRHQSRVILFDEIHSRWESTLIDYDRNSQEPLAENSYHSFLDYISRFYHTYIVTNQDIELPIKRVKTIHRPELSMELLTQFNQPVTLVLKCITTPFSQEEIKVIVEFVRQGGSLFLIGDHTDVYFMNRYLNRLSKNFGIEFEPNAVYMIDGGWLITDKNDLAKHPITQFMDTFIWATGCSLRLKSPAYAVVHSPLASFADYGSYFNEYFFGNGKVDAYEACGSHAIIGAAEFGKGRIVAFTDSTCFNNYLMFSIGRRELLKGVFQWLESRGSFNPFIFLGVIGLLGLILMQLKWQLDKQMFVYILITLLPFGLVCGQMIGRWANAYCYVEPRPSITPLPKGVIIDATHKSTHCLNYGNSDDYMGETSYDNFVYTLGRVDLQSSINYNQPISQRLLKDNRILVLISPTRPFSNNELEAITEFVKSGNSLLLIEGPNPRTTINQVASLFKLKFRKEPFPYLNVNQTRLVNPTYLEGGKPLFLFKDIPIVSYARFGKGIVFGLGDDNLFTRLAASSLIQLECDLMVNLWQVDEDGLKLIDWSSLAQAETRDHR